MKRFGMILMASIIAFGILLIPVQPANAAQPERYGYSLLTSDIQRTAYQEIVDGIMNVKAEIALSMQANQSNYAAIGEEITTALNMVIKDYPEFFWFTGAHKLSLKGTTVSSKYTLFPDYKLNGQPVSAGDSQLSAAKIQIQQAINSALETVPNQASDYEIALALHDYLVERVQYVSEGDHQTAYGSLVSGKAVCAGYARAYQLLMNAAGIPCTYITGESVDPKMLAAGVEELQPHAWNLVWLDGKCYYTDVTWDDQGINGLFHEYLNLSLEEISTTHFPDDAQILPDSCSHDDYRFFIKNSGKGICDIQEHIDGADAAECFVLKSIDGRNAEYYCTIHYHKDDFTQWFSANYRSIGEKLGYESFECQLVEIGHEHHVLYTGVLLESAPEPSMPATEETQSSTQETPAPTQGSTASTQTTTQSTQTLTQATEPTAEETVPVSDPTAPAEPTEPPASPTESNPADSKDEGNSNSDSNESTSTMPVQSESISQSDPNTPTESTTSTAPTDAAQQPNSSGTVIIITIAVLLVGAGIGAALYFVRKKR